VGIFVSVACHWSQHSVRQKLLIALVVGRHCGVAMAIRLCVSLSTLIGALALGKWGWSC